jgi:uroporphyrinogen-III synthase
MRGPRPGSTGPIPDAACALPGGALQTVVTLILTRASDDNQRFAAQLAGCALSIIDYPCIDFTMHSFAGDEVDGHSLSSFAAVAFTSHRAVPGVARVAHEFQREDLVLSAVGQRTAAAIEAVLGRIPRVVSQEGTGADLGRRLAAVLAPGATVLHVRGGATTGHLGAALVAAGLAVVPLVVYENHAPELVPLEVRGPCVALFASPSAVHRFHAANPELVRELTAVAIGPTTADSLKKVGAGHVVAAARPTAEELLKCVSDLLERWSDG